MRLKLYVMYNIRFMLHIQVFFLLVNKWKSLQHVLFHSISITINACIHKREIIGCGNVWATVFCFVKVLLQRFGEN